MSLAGHLGAAALLDVPAGDEPTHGVADEDDLRVGIRPALGPRLLERRLDDGLQASAVVAVGQAPVVRVRHERRRLAAGAALVALLLERADEHVVAADRRPDARQDVDVGHERDRLDAVTRVVVADPLRQGLLEDRLAAGQEPSRRRRRSGPR